MDSHYYSDIPPGGASLRGAQYGTPWWTRGATWDPGPVETQDPHDGPLDVGDGPPAVAAVPENITGKGDFPVAAEFDQGGGAFDVNPGAFDIDAAYDQGGGGYGPGDFGPIADNIIIGDE